MSPKDDEWSHLPNYIVFWSPPFNYFCYPQDDEISTACIINTTLLVDSHHYLNLCGRRLLQQNSVLVVGEITFFTLQNHNNPNGCL